MSFKPVEELTFADDFMFTKVMKNKSICKGLLERLLGIKISKIEYPEIQKNLSPFYESKGIRLDVYVDDGSRVFDIEIQTYVPESIGKRLRYYQSILDMDCLQRGAVYTELKESYIIFICTFDPFGFSIPVYTFKNTCQEKKDFTLKDNSTKIIFNALDYQKENNLEIKSILEYLINRNSTNDFTDKINQQVEKLKYDERFKGEYMMVNLHEWELSERAKKQGWEEGHTAGVIAGRLEGIEAGKIEGEIAGQKRGAEQKAIETANKLISMGLTIEQVAEGTGLPLEKVQELAKS